MYRIYSSLGDKSLKINNFVPFSQSSCADGSCTCTVYGDCYKTKQDVWINNCWFVDTRDTNSIRLDYAMINAAGLEAAGSYLV